MAGARHRGLRLHESHFAPQRLSKRAAASGTVFSPNFIVRTLQRESGACRDLGLTRVLEVVQRWRDALLTQVNDAPESVRRLVSGHDDEGGPLDGPHLAFVPLPLVGHPHAGGALVGMGLVLPKAIGCDEQRHVLRATSRIDRLFLGRLGVWRVGRAVPAERWRDCRPQVWTAHSEGAMRWSTVTPVAFDRHPKATHPVAYESAVSRMIAEACVRIGLPAPKEVIATAVSAHLGVPPAHAFPRLERKDGSRRRHAHAILVFEKPVQGPILIGAGRFRGYGACRPIDPIERL